MASTDYKHRPFNGLAMRLHRLKRRMTVEEAIEALDKKGVKIARSTIFRWETGERDPKDMRVLRKFATIYRCNVEAFFHEPIVTYAGAPPPSKPKPIRKRRPVA